ncbi:MAG: T9SS type A sorting domain-containing protein [Flavobacteriales bacterium]
MTIKKHILRIKRPLIFIATSYLIPFIFSAQTGNFPFEVVLKADSITGFNGLHSFAWGQQNGKVLLVGGRPDGIHARQPFNAFPASQNNQQLQVLDLISKQSWSRSLTELSTSLQEQLQSTNMNFYQDGNTLILTGGYAYSNSANDHITFPYLTTIKLDGLIQAIIDNQPVAPYFKQIQDEHFAVTGGNIGKIGSQYYLVGGHRFDGRYNPMNNPTFVQTYTDGLKKFELTPWGQPLAVLNYQEISDQVNLHRRDYNLLPHIYPNGELGYLISSGVFQINADLPFLYPVEIKANGHNAVNGFSQYLSNYHSSKFSAFDSATGIMNHLFLGGLSQYYYQNGTLINDPNVPFVKTISLLSQGSDSVYHEYVMATEMPALLGASAEFVADDNIPFYAQDIIDLAALTGDSILIGHVIGGIKSPTLNPFTNNNTGVTDANAVIYEVWLKRATTSSIEVISETIDFNVTLNPNPTKEVAYLDFDLGQKANVECFILDTNGKLVHEVYYEKIKKAKKTIDLKELGLQPGTYTIQLIFNDQHTITKKLQVRAEK